MSTGLIVIDMQESLLREETWDADRVLTHVQELVLRARDAGVPVIWVTDERVAPDGWVASGLFPRTGEPILAKATCDAFHGTGLAGVLAELGIGHLVIAGLHTDFCIDTTCRAALSRGYDVTLAGDAHSSFERDYAPVATLVDHHNRILNGLSADGHGIAVARTAEIAF